MKSKRERFVDVAAKRTEKVLDALDSLASCSNKNNYEYDGKDIQKMMGAIKRKVKFLEDTYQQQISKGKDNSFKF